MSRRRVDELRTARALRALDEHAAAHPEAFDPDRLPGTTSELAAVIGERRKVGRPASEDPTVSFGLRLPGSLVERIDAARGKRPRNDIVREAIERWLKAVKRRNR